MDNTVTVTFLIIVYKNYFPEYITWMGRDTKIKGFVPGLVINVCINQYCVIIVPRVCVCVYI